MNTELEARIRREFFIYDFPHRLAADACRSALARHGFIADTRTSVASGTLSVIAAKVGNMSDELKIDERLVKHLAAEFGGEYDGWSADGPFSRDDLEDFDSYVASLDDEGE